MNILLINPSQKEVYGALFKPDHPPIGLGYLGGILEKNGHRVTILDIDADKISDDELIANILEGRIDIVGIMTLTPTFNSALNLSEIIKQKDVKTILANGPFGLIENRSFRFGTFQVALSELGLEEQEELLLQFQVQGCQVQLGLVLGLDLLWE